MANPAIPCSLNGVLNTFIGPCFSNSFSEHRNTPPKATSSPNKHALTSPYMGSRDKAKSIALLIASVIVRVVAARPMGTSGEEEKAKEAKQRRDCFILRFLRETTIWVKGLSCFGEDAVDRQLARQPGRAGSQACTGCTQSLGCGL